MSFFADIQNWFSGGFYGRHLGLILREIGKHRPNAFASFLTKKTGISIKELKTARYECEYSFSGKRGIRLADLAVFIGEEATPRILIEIKYFDKPLPETEVKPAQFDDYRFWKSQDDTREVIVLSRELYRVNDLIICRWNEFAFAMRPFASHSDLIQMLVEYLQEEGLVIQNIDGGSLVRYFKRLVCPTLKSGVSANNIEGPVEFSKLLKNMKQFAGVFDVSFKNAWLLAREKHDKYDSSEAVERSLKAASIDFNVDLYVAENSVALVDENGLLRDKCKDGGKINIFAQHSLGNGSDRYLRINYGIRIIVSSDDKFSGLAKSRDQSAPICHLYAHAWGKRINGLSDFYREKKIPFSMITERAALSVEKIDLRLHKLLTEVVSHIVDAAPPVELVQKKALRELEKALLQKVPSLVEAAD